MNQRFCTLTVKDLSKKIELLEISPIELVEHYLDKIKKLSRIFNTFITIADENEICEKEIEKIWGYSNWQK